MPLPDKQLGKPFEAWEYVARSVDLINGPACGRYYTHYEIKPGWWLEIYQCPHCEPCHKAGGQYFAMLSTEMDGISLGNSNNIDELVERLALLAKWIKGEQECQQLTTF